MSYAEMAGVGQPAAEAPEPDVAPPADAPPAPAPAFAPVLSSQTPDADVRTVLENGIREISGEVRNSLDFHRSQEGGGEVSHVVLSGAAQESPASPRRCRSSSASRSSASRCTRTGSSLDGISAHRLAVAAGLAVEEAPR